jgi:hypothetical protein
MEPKSELWARELVEVVPEVIVFWGLYEPPLHGEIHKGFFRRLN